MSRTMRAVLLVAALALAVVVAACGDSEGSDGGGDADGTPVVDAGSSPTGTLEDLPEGTEELCGDRPIRIAQVDGFGANSWRKIVRAELESELEPCDNVEIAYSQAGGDIQKYNTAINSYAAQGYDAILTFDDFGPQGLPAIRKAYQSGVVVVPYISETGGTPGEDFTVEVRYDRAKVGEMFANWLNETLDGEGKAIFMGGVPGNPGSQIFLENTIENTAPGIEWLQDKPVDTNWDPAQYQRVTTGLISKYPKIDAYVSDYGAGSVGQLRAYMSAGKPHPPLATLASSNELGCLYQQQKDKWPDFEMIWLEGTTRAVRWAARRALATLNDIELNDPTTGFELYAFVDTTAGKEPECRDDLPPDADLSSGLTPEELEEVFN